MRIPTWHCQLHTCLVAHESITFTWTRRMVFATSFTQIVFGLLPLFLFPPLADCPLRDHAHRGLCPGPLSPRPASPRPLAGVARRVDDGRPLPMYPQRDHPGRSDRRARLPGLATRIRSRRPGRFRPWHASMLSLFPLTRPPSSFACDRVRVRARLLLLHRSYVTWCRRHTSGRGRAGCLSVMLVSLFSLCPPHPFCPLRPGGPSM